MDLWVVGGCGGSDEMAGKGIERSSARKGGTFWGVWHGYTGKNPGSQWKNHIIFGGFSEISKYIGFS